MFLLRKSLWRTVSPEIAKCEWHRLLWFFWWISWINVSVSEERAKDTSPVVTEEVLVLQISTANIYTAGLPLSHPHWFQHRFLWFLHLLLSSSESNTKSAFFFTIINMFRSSVPPPPPPRVWLRARTRVCDVRRLLTQWHVDPICAEPTSVKAAPPEVSPDDITDAGWLEIWLQRGGHWYRPTLFHSQMVISSVNKWFVQFFMKSPLSPSCPVQPPAEQWAPWWFLETSASQRVPSDVWTTLLPSTSWAWETKPATGGNLSL